jgi:hypothetical protein
MRIANGIVSGNPRVVTSRAAQPVNNPGKVARILRGSAS